MHLFWLVAGLLIADHAVALDIEQLEIEKDGRSYDIMMTFTIAASPGEVIAVLTDYDNPDRLNPDVKKQEVIGVFDGASRVLTDVRSCLFLFCRNITMVQDVSVDGTTIQADIVPGLSNFRSGSMRWSVTQRPDSMSTVVYTATMEPDVFIPPLIGRALIRNMLENEVRGAAARLEAKTSLQSGPEQQAPDTE